MKTSVNEMKEIEDFLLGRVSVENGLLFQAKLVLDRVLRNKVRNQYNVYELIKLYGRKVLKQEIEDVNHRLFNSPEHKQFQRSILKIFQNP